MHLKRLNVPKTWPIPRKGMKFAVTPNPGPHAKMDCVPLRIILRDMTGLADTAREAKAILNQGMILVDKKPRKAGRFPVGLMDVIEMPEAKQHFRMVTGKSGLGLEKIAESESSWKLCKITGKTTLKGGVQQLNLHDGRSLRVKKDSYKVGDTVMITLPDQKILRHLKLERGAECLVIDGRNIGSWGKIKEIDAKEHMLEKPTITLDTGKREIKTLKDYIFVAERNAKAPAHAKPAKSKEAL
jgi:small subunit ribosomal protein S4e